MTFILNGRPGQFASAEVLRRLDDEGISRNDKCTIYDSDVIAELESHFPELLTKQESTVHAAWFPWIIIRFRAADGTPTYVESDYRIYRIGDGKRGDFVVKGDFAALTNRLTYLPANPTH